MIGRGVCGLLCALAFGCAPAAESSSSSGADAGDAQGMDDSSESESTTQDGGGIPTPEACELTDDCRDGVCAASWDQAQAGLLRPFSCRPECVDSGDAVSVCADDDACCADLRCDELGFCVSLDPESGEESGDASGP